LKFRVVSPGTGGTYWSISLSVCGLPTTGRYVKNRPSAVDFGHLRLIEGEIDRRRSIEGDRRSEKKKKRKKKKRRRNKTSIVAVHRSPARRRPCPVVAYGSPAHCHRPHPRAIFLPREETERLPVRGERSRRHIQQAVSPNSDIVNCASDKKVGTVTTALGSCGLGLVRVEEVLKQSPNLRIKGQDEVRIKAMIPDWWPAEWTQVQEQQQSAAAA
ncbi:hypothetical protein GW17_00019703, partial [Ensete ventricosum]